ncbi:MAG: ParA family protein [Thermomicrobiales bacterium]
MTRVVAVANQKGGVGKTTTTVNVAAWLADSGANVLVIDLDPQGNLTSTLGIDRAAVADSSYELLVGEADIAEVTLPEVRPGLDLIAARPDLAGAEVELAALDRKESQLQRSMSAQAVYYDVIMIDCPPSLGLLTINALSASSDVIIPIQCEYLALEGLMQMTNSIDLVRRRINPDLEILGVVMTMFDARTRLAADVVENVREHFSGHSFEAIIPRSVRLAEAPSYGQTIVEYAPDSSGALAYRKLAHEVAARLGLSDSIREIDQSASSLEIETVSSGNGI